MASNCDEEISILIKDEDYCTTVLSFHYYEDIFYELRKGCHFQLHDNFNSTMFNIVFCKRNFIEQWKQPSVVTDPPMYCCWYYCWTFREANVSSWLRPRPSTNQSARSPLPLPAVFHLYNITSPDDYHNSCSSCGFHAALYLSRAGHFIRSWQRNLFISSPQKKEVSTEPLVLNEIMGKGPTGEV